VRAKRLIIRDFLALREMTLDLDNRGLVLIVGPHGAGKSTIIEAMSVVMTGRPIRKIRMADLINNLSQSTEVVLETDEGKFRFCRGERRRSNLPILPVGREALFHSYLCPDTEIGKPFINYSARSQAELLLTILATDIYTKASKRARERAKAVRADLERLGNAVSNAKGQIAASSRVMEHVLQKLNKAREIRDSEEAKLRAREEVLRRIESADEVEIVNEIKKLKERRFDLSSRIDRAAAIENQILRLRDDVARADDAILTLEQKIAKKTKQVESWTKLTEEAKCPLCQQPLDHQAVSNVLAKFEKEAADMREELSELKSERAKMRASIENLEAQRDLVDELTAARDALTAEITKYEAWLKDLEGEKSKVAQELAAIEEKRVALAQSVSDIENDVEKVRDMISAAESAFLKVSSEYEAHHFDWEMWKIISDLYAFDIPAECLRSSCKTIATFVMDRMYGLGYPVSIDFTMVRDEGKISIDMNATDDKGVSYEGWCRSNKRRLQLCLSSAFRRLMPFDFNVAILDEPLVGLNEQSVENVLGMLREELDMCSSIFVLSPREDFIPLFDEVIRIQ